MYHFTLIYSVFGRKLFSPSIYDFRVDPAKRIYEGYSGFLSRHYYVQDEYHFGDLSIMTLNAHIDRDTLLKSQHNNILGLIDTHHPAIFALQGVEQEEANMLESAVGEHYEVACKGTELNDVWNNRIERMPVFFDSKSLMKIRESVFEPKEYAHQPYGCAVVFYSLITQQVFTLVNVDLPSTDEKVIDTQVYNILENFENSMFRSFPILIAGTINTMSDKLRRLVQSSFLNLNELDRNNQGLSKTTFHHHGQFDDNIQRDFILMKDPRNELRLNYSRTLSRYPKTDVEHFPVFAILSRNNKDSIRKEQDSRN